MIKCQPTVTTRSDARPRGARDTKQAIVLIQDVSQHSASLFSTGFFRPPCCQGDTEMLHDAFFFHSSTVHLDIISLFISPTDGLYICLVVH